MKAFGTYRQESETRGGTPMPEPGIVVVRCGSCGWIDEHLSSADASYRGANHLRVCPSRDDLRFVPWWTQRPTNTGGGVVFEVGWHPLDVNEPHDVVDPYGPLAPTSDPRRYTMATRRVAPARRYRFTEWADREVIGVRQAAA